MKKTNEEFLVQLAIKNPFVDSLEMYQGANYKGMFRCKKCGYEWEAKTSHVLRGHGCPICGGSKRLTNEQFLERLKMINPFLTPLEPYKNAKTKIPCRCVKCSCTVTVAPDKLLYSGYQCAECTKRYKTSFPEQAITYYLSLILNDKSKVINRYRGFNDITELDVYIPSINTAIEYDGIYWHNGKLEKDINKHNACKSHGIKLIRVIEQAKNHPMEELMSYADDIVVRHAPFVFNSLDVCLGELFQILKLSFDRDFINTQRDSAEIQSLFFSEISKNSMLELYPEIAKEWLQEKNGKITPGMVLYGSNTPYYWKCSLCGYIWKASPADRTIQKKGCKQCAINRARLRYTKSNELFVEQLTHVNPDIIPLEKYQTTHKSIMCRCLVCGNEWPAAPANLLRGRKCPKCSKIIAAKKISETKKGKVTEFNAGKSIGVTQLTLDGSFVANYSSLNEAARAINIKGGGAKISAVCKGERKTAYGFLWKYTKDI